METSGIRIEEAGGMRSEVIEELRAQINLGREQLQGREDELGEWGPVRRKVPFDPARYRRLQLLVIKQLAPHRAKQGQVAYTIELSDRSVDPCARIRGRTRTYAGAGKQSDEREKHESPSSHEELVAPSPRRCGAPTHSPERWKRRSSSRRRSA